MTAYAVREPTGSGLAGFGQWRYRTAVDAFPAAGRLQFDDTTIDNATELYVNVTNDNSTDMSAFLALIEPGDLIYLQVSSDSTQFVVCEVGTSSNAAGVYTFPLTQVEGQGSAPGNNTLVTFVSTVGGGVPGDHGALSGLADDDHLQYFLLAGRAGGQVAYGSPTNGEDLTLAGNPGANPGFINMNSPVIFGPYTGNPSAAYGFDYSVVDNPAGVFIGGGLNFSGNITTGSTTFIYESFRGAPTITMGAAPGFAAYTVLQALPQINAAAGFNPISPLIVNAGVSVRNPVAQVRTVTSVVGVNFASTLVGAVNGATLNCTNWTGLTVAPNWNTVAGSTINFGTIIGMDVRAPAQALFGGSAGTERMAAFYGMQVANPTINNSFGSAPCAAIRSSILSGANRYFLLNAGTAPSDMGAAHMYFDDNFGVAFGGAGVANFDFWHSWNGAGNYYRQFFFSSASALRWSSPANNRFLFDSDGGNTSGEYNFNFFKASFGAQTGANGNSFLQFPCPARATAVNGGWVDVSFSQAGNLTIDHTMSDVSMFNAAAISLTGGAGSITGYITTFNVGMTTSGVTGVETSALRPNGRIHHRGVVEMPPLTPGVLGASVNNYSPATFNSMRQIWRVASSLAVNITGILVPTSNNPADTQWLTNVGSFAITLTHQDAASTAGNRFISPTGANYVIGPDESACLWHDPTTDRWRILWGSGA